MRYSIPFPRHPELQMSIQMTILMVSAKPVKNRSLGTQAINFSVLQPEMLQLWRCNLHKFMQCDCTEWLPALSTPTGSYLYVDKS